MRIFSDRGSAPVEFLLLGLPMLLVFLLAGQVTLLSHQKQRLQDAAIEAAMFGALADQSATAAKQKANELFGQAEAIVIQGEQTISVSLKLNSLVKLEAVAIALLENHAR